MKRFLFLILAALLFAGSMPITAQALYVNSDIQSPTITRRVTNLAALKTITGKTAIQSVELMGRVSEGDGGEGIFRWLAGDQSAHADVLADTQEGLFVKPTTPGDGSTGVWARLVLNIINPKWFGAKGDGVTDDTTALQAAHDMGRNVLYSSGNYIISTAIQLTPGTKIVGENASSFSVDIDKRTVKITNNTVGGGCFWYTGDTDIVQKTAPHIEEFYLIADYPIRYNDRTADISDGGPQPYLMQPHIIGCTLTPRVNGTGYGIDIAKCFDGVIERCEISKFEANIVLTGCDLNAIQNNRIREGYSYNILEFATGSFGSQNEIRHNDIVKLSDSSGISIRTNSRHVRIYDNYLEATSALVGFIDISKTNMPAIFGSNTPAVPFTVDVTGNRIDGHSLATSFVYRLNPTGIYHRIIDVGTTGTVTDSLIIEGDLLPVRYSAIHRMHYDFRGEQFGKWNNFTTGKQLQSSNGSLLVTCESYASLDKDAPNTDNAGDHTRFDADAIVILDTHTMSQRWYPDSPGFDGNNNEHFHTGNSYTVKFVAKTDSVSGDTFQLGKILNGTGGGLTNYTLTEQYQTFTFSMTGAMGLTDIVGIYFTRSTTNGNIKIRSLEWSKT